MQNQYINNFIQKVQKKLNEVDQIILAEQNKNKPKTELENNKMELFNEMFENKKVRIFGNFENPLFVAKDIGDILELKDINSTIFKGEFSENIHFIICHGKYPGLIHNAKVLTERGLYKIISKSRSKIANKFEEFIYNLLHDLRTKKILLIENQLQKQNKIIEEKNKEIEKIKNDPLRIYNNKMMDKAEIYNKGGIIYIVTSKENEKKSIYKVGITRPEVKKTRMTTMNTSQSTEEQACYIKYEIEINGNVHKMFETILHTLLIDLNIKRVINDKDKGHEWFYVDYEILKKIYDDTKEYSDKLCKNINDMKPKE